MEIWGCEGSCVAMKVYSEEFKADAVALYVSDPGSTYASVAKGLGVNRGTLRLWVRQARAGHAAVHVPDRPRESEAGSVASGAVLEDENRQLRKKARELEAERDILRRAAKYFARETNW